MRSLFLTILLLVGMVAGPGVGRLRAAPAAPAPLDVGRAAVMPPVIKPPLDSAVTTRFRKAVDDGLTLAAIVTAHLGEVDRRRLESVGACSTPQCLTRLAGLLKVRWIWSLEVKRTGKNYKLRLWLHDPRARFRVDQKGTCDICTFSEAITRAQRLAQQAGTELRRLVVATLPRPEPPRKKMRPRPEPPRRKARPKPRLRPRPKPKPKPKPKPWYTPNAQQRTRQAAWMSGVGGIASLAAGITLLALDGRYTCDQEPRRLMCEYRYGTGTAGAVFTALGGASMVASAVLFYYGYFRKQKSSGGGGERPRPTVTLSPTRGGIWAHAQFRF